MPALPKHKEAERSKALGWMLSRLVPPKPEWLGKPQTESDIVFHTVRLSDVESEEIECLWPGRFLRNKLNQIQGEPGLGKTMMLLDILAHITKGTKFCDGAECPQGEVLFITSEDGIGDTVRPRMDKLDADVTKVHCMTFVVTKGKEVALQLDKHLNAIDAWLEAHPRVIAIGIDPLGGFLGEVDSHRNSEVRGLLGQVAKLAEKRKVGIIAIDHLNKSLGKAMHRGMGSIAFTAAPRSVWQVVGDPDQPRRSLLLNLKFNVGKAADGLAYRLTDDGGLAWEDGAVTVTADDMASDTGDTPREEAKEWLIELLNEHKGALEAKQVEWRAGDDKICMRTLKYAKKELGIDSKRVGKAWSWVLPEKLKSATTK